MDPSGFVLILKTHFESVAPFESLSVTVSHVLFRYRLLSSSRVPLIHSFRLGESKASRKVSGSMSSRVFCTCALRAQCASEAVSRARSLSICLSSASFGFQSAYLVLVFRILF